MRTTTCVLSHPGPKSMKDAVSCCKGLQLLKFQSLSPQSDRRSPRILRSSPWSWLPSDYFMGDQAGAWSEALDTPLPSSHSLYISCSLKRHPLSLEDAECQKWMDEEAYLLNLLDLKTSLRNCLSQTLLAVGNTLKGSITLCFPVSIHFPKHLLLATVGVTRPDGP